MFDVCMFCGVVCVMFDVCVCCSVCDVFDVCVWDFGVMFVRFLMYICVV